jgi:hypothetical protein
MPDTNPFTSAVNLVPTWTPFGSSLSGVEGTVEPKIVHGHAGDPARGDAGLDVDDDPVPITFVATTANVYVVPFVSPEITAEVAGGEPLTVVDVCAAPPMNGVTVYEVIGLPPVGGAVQATDTFPEPAPDVATTFPGGAGGAAGVTLFEGCEGGPVPMSLVADTVNVYVVPLASPVTVVDGLGGEPLMIDGSWAVVPTKGVTV